MPPREESAAYAIEDAMIFAQILARGRGRPLSDLFLEYENARRELLDKASNATRRLWKNDLEKGLFPSHFRNCMSPIQRPADPSLDKTTSDSAQKRIFLPPTHENVSDLSIYTLTSELEGAVDADKDGVIKMRM